MLEFLISQGLEFTRVSCWPDYYDEMPGGVEAGRTVVPRLFNVNELGPWKQKLRIGRFAGLPAETEEAIELPYYKLSWLSRWLVLKVGVRGTMAKLTGKTWVGAGMALQGRMLQASARAGVEIRTDSPVSELIVEHGTVKGVVTSKEGRPWRVGARPEPRSYRHPCRSPGRSFASSPVC